MPALPPPNTAHSIPTAFRVATSSTPRTSNAEEELLYQAFQSQAASRAISTASTSSLKIKLEWIEKLSVPGVPLSTLKASLDHLDSTSWQDLIAERHMEGLCPYPTCSKKASTPYGVDEGEEGAVERKFKLHGGALYDAGPRTVKGKDKGPYCSVQCRARSEWVKGVLGKEGRRDLLEEVEKRREKVKETTEELVREQEKEQGKQGEKETFKNDLLSSLTIHEKPTTTSSTNPPVAPSLDQASIDFERPNSDPAPRSSSSRFPLDPSSSSSSFALSNTSSALLPFTTTSLGRTILSSSRRPPTSLPVPASRQPRAGINGLPPVKFLSEPRMIDEKGREIEWADTENDGLEGEEAELRRGMLDEALEVRRMVEKGEL
ncbi:Rtr1/RPAP2 family protein phosphatase [Sporobolomyces salmoneus]|uniref:Rtr1/RPAP2 family protein phosphatase n=1 Tax=Sporobolomyces salmoneus TaxID=183962 RepID=UPI00316BE471